MQIKSKVSPLLDRGLSLSTVLVLLMSGCSGGDGPAVKAYPQTISFNAAPALSHLGTASVSATASSGLAVSYSSITPAVCSVDSNTGLVTDIAQGTCTIAADQSGNTTYAPAPQATQNLAVIFNPVQTISFAAPPALSFGGTALVSATASSGLAVSYSSLTPLVCSVATGTGLVTDSTAGSCIIAANQAGDINYNPAPQMTQTLTVTVPAVPTAPGAPTGVTATLGNLANTVTVNIGATDSGGSPITGYTVSSTPAGLTATGLASSFTLSCPTTCSGYAFSVVASNAIGNSLPSLAAHILTSYNIVETFFEPDTQPRNTIFTGSFMLDTTTGTVANLAGQLTESMTGNPASLLPGYGMTLLLLNNQLSAVSDGLGGLLVTTFKLNTTNTLTNNPLFGGTDGWAPGSGLGYYFGFPSAINPAAPGGVGNAYVRAYINLANPTVALSQAQIDKLAYADCAAGGMMGVTCMTGTTVAGYGTIGTMSGYPISQIITRR